LGMWQKLRQMDDELIAKSRDRRRRAPWWQSAFLTVVTAIWTVILLGRPYAVFPVAFSVVVTIALAARSISAYRQHDTPSRSSLQTAAGIACALATVAVMLVVLALWSSRPRASAGPSIKPCSSESRTRSLASSRRTSLAFTNERPTLVDIYWLNYRGARVLYHRLEGGGPGVNTTWIQSTFVTHPWLIAEKGGTCLEIVLPGAKASSVTIR